MTEKQLLLGDIFYYIHERRKLYTNFSYENYLEWLSYFREVRCDHYRLRKTVSKVTRNRSRGY